MHRPEERDSEVDYGETCTTNRVRMKRSSIKVVSFNEKVWECRSTTELPYLRPESAVHDRCVHVENLLPLDDRFRSQQVVAGRQSEELDVRSKLPERVGYSACLLVDVTHYADGHARRIGPNECTAYCPS